MATTQNLSKKQKKLKHTSCKFWSSWVQNLKHVLRVTYDEIHLIEFKEIISIQLQFHSITYLKYLFYYKYLLIYVIQTHLEVQSLALVCWLINSYIHRTPSTRKQFCPSHHGEHQGFFRCRQTEGSAGRIQTKINEQDDFREW